MGFPDGEISWLGTSPGQDLRNPCPKFYSLINRSIDLLAPVQRHNRFGRRVQCRANQRQFVSAKSSRLCIVAMRHGRFWNGWIRGRSDRQFCLWEWDAFSFHSSSKLRRLWQQRTLIFSWGHLVRQRRLDDGTGNLAGWNWIALEMVKHIYYIE